MASLVDPVDLGMLRAQCWTIEALVCLLERRNYSAMLGSSYHESKRYLRSQLPVSTDAGAPIDGSRSACGNVSLQLIGGSRRWNEISA